MPNQMQKNAAKRMRRTISAVMRRGGADKHNAVRDLLTDVRHYCEAEGVNFYNAAKGAYQVYLEERTADE